MLPGLQFEFSEKIKVKKSPFEILLFRVFNGETITVLRDFDVRYVSSKVTENLKLKDLNICLKNFSTICYRPSYCKKYSRRKISNHIKRIQTDSQRFLFIVETKCTYEFCFRNEIVLLLAKIISLKKGFPFI